MKSFEEVWKFTDKISYETAFWKVEGQAFYNALVSLPRESTIVEIGIQHGRSTSIIAQVAKEMGHNLFLVDPAPEEDFEAMIQGIGVDYTLYRMKTAEVPEALIPQSIDFVHIDGDHEAEGVTTDCDRLLHRVRTGGYACFHDYGQHSLPHVKPTADRYVRNPNWREVSHDYTLLIMGRN